MCKKEWICKICGKSTKDVEYDYLCDIDLHLECALNNKLIRKKKLEKIKLINKHINRQILNK